MVNDKYKEKYEKIKIELIKILIVSKDRTLKEVEIINKLGINQGKEKTLRKIFNKLIQDSVIAVDRNNRGNYKKGVARYTQVNSPARSSICLVNQTLFDKYSGDFDTDNKSLERSEKRLESICTNYNEKVLKYERLQKLHPSPSEKTMSVVENVTTGIVLGRNGNTFIISTKDGEMYYVTAGNTKVKIGDKVIVQLFKSIDDSKNQKVKILCNKNNSNNI